MGKHKRVKKPKYYTVIDLVTGHIYSCRWRSREDAQGTIDRVFVSEKELYEIIEVTDGPS